MLAVPHGRLEPVRPLPAGATRKRTMAVQQAVPSARALAPYAQPHLGRALLDIATSVVPYFALTVLMYLSLDVSYLLTLALAVPAAAFLLRTFILFHDCTHGAFVPTRRANTWLGVALGVIVFQPFHSWRYNHAVHHGTAGDLDRRGTGDVQTLTVAEFTALPWRGRLRVPPVPQPARDVRVRAAVRARPPAAPAAARLAAADPAQHHRDGHRPAW